MEMGGSVSSETPTVQNSQIGCASLLPPPRISKNASFSKLVSSSRRSSGISPNDDPGHLNALEIEAVAAVHELRSLVKDIYVSDKLPRTPDLIYLNLTTLEGDAFCVELTSLKGWRVSSLRHDCMNGDIAHLDLHVQYFDTMQALMRHVSPAYDNKVKNTLSVACPISGGHTSTESECDPSLVVERQTFT